MVPREKNRALQSVNLRVPINMLQTVDEIVCRRMGLSRNAWILEAIQEKIEGKLAANQRFHSDIEMVPKGYSGDTTTVLRQGFATRMIFRLFFKPCKFITFYNPLR